jgi:UPF0042 nucleotide-binding protein
MKLISFGFKSGEVPTPCAQVFDVRNLRNPHSDRRLRDLTGQDKAVQAYVVADPSFTATMNEIMAAVSKAKSGAIAVGCFGGRHRSVAMVELIAKALRMTNRQVEVVHRELA